MLVPGLTFTSGRVEITAGAGIVPNFFNQGLGFMNDGSLAVDTDVPTGSVYRAGFRISPNGAIYGVDEAASTPSHSIQGLLVEASGRLIYDSVMAIDVYTSGNPVDTDGVLAVN